MLALSFARAHDSRRYEGVPEQVLEAIFDAIDEDATYKIGFAEFKTWLASDGKSKPPGLSPVARRSGYELASGKSTFF